MFWKHFYQNTFSQKIFEEFLKRKYSENSLEILPGNEVSILDKLRNQPIPSQRFLNNFHKNSQ